MALRRQFAHLPIRTGIAALCNLFGRIACGMGVDDSASIVLADRTGPAAALLLARACALPGGRNGMGRCARYFTFASALGPAQGGFASIAPADGVFPTPRRRQHTHVPAHRIGAGTPALTSDIGRGERSLR